MFYASEKGYLEDLNIKLVINVSLAEAADVFSIGRADLVTTTQHEYYYLKDSSPDIVPIITIDRSYGGDMILSNRNMEALKKADEIYAYLEIDSINSDILEEFIKNNSLDEKKIKFINRDQAQIQDIKNRKDRVIVIVTYTPYDFALKQKGFKEVASTRDLNSIIVIDALCATKALLLRQKSRLEKLKNIIDKSINQIQKNTKESYRIVKPFLNNISYREYLDSLKTIKWIDKPSEDLLMHIGKLGYKEKYLIK